jgi:hypothetical protein
MAAMASASEVKSQLWRAGWTFNVRWARRVIACEKDLNGLVVVEMEVEVEEEEEGWAG